MNKKQHMAADTVNHDALMDRINNIDTKTNEHTEIPLCKNWRDFARLQGDRRFEFLISVNRFIDFLKRRKI